ncbi:hypothetical protein BATDEDRAFT_36254 [Batrachochytrium dendrobatidis JAM81]|uniref:40S ribosomal protein S19-A n=2 Tax=Batrachochytrium dendrobatidis TaxID=109871 RepID=F4PE42_BATDJ|nr:uncharacterized protein BATDEDRAFT_36254 [Batrachochytrium dendrobatidis JAM81]EGF76489.1 hypothetical protein BATDEDRAFT_36254 [Batrachochytrium dendrobatidis JAM81]KAJ8331904.1 Protein component of the small (40S) ribosomal subunit [Batrachochytrium dendrobatidis]KAK5672637.1 Protein component of the small (40S) ribosomal subunit [Batrachochytrium dendrobatidis]OAJ39211.1 ribosomal protein S19e [Batrachochytrium dendrobatidis JEL423]|eukprot:XP_006682862.1 hypothetical protein BATDEDRAFT_36254 [Batrachochytrium dendrobatidis JAM81]
MSRGVTVKDVSSHEFIKAYSAYLKRTGKLELPKWVDLVKTGADKELAPYDPDWYYVRAASVARHIYLRGGVGVGGLRKNYGGTKNRGSKPHHGGIGSGSIARAIFHSLEKIKVLQLHPNGGRKISVDGQKDLDRIAQQIVESQESSQF